MNNLQNVFNILNFNVVGVGIREGMKVCEVDERGLSSRGKMRVTKLHPCEMIKA